MNPCKTKEYTCKQSKYSHAGALPTRSLFLGPSFTGKTTVLTHLLLDVHKNCNGKHLCGAQEKIVKSTKSTDYTTI